MRAELGLPSVKGDDEHGGGMTGGFGGSMGGAGQGGKGKRPISVKFEIPYFTTSGIQVRYLKIIEPKVSCSSLDLIPRVLHSLCGPLVGLAGGLGRCWLRRIELLDRIDQSVHACSLLVQALLNGTVRWTALFPTFVSFCFLVSFD